MSENLITHEELAPDIQTFLTLIHRKTGKLEPEERVSFIEADYIGRRSYDSRYICDVIADPDPNQPYGIDLWAYVSPIWYSKEEYRFDTETGAYMRSGVSAEPDSLETVPPYIHEEETRLANPIDLGRVVGILEYLEKDTPIHETDKVKPRSGSRIANWILGSAS